MIRGHNIMKGYWRKPEATEEAMRGGWFHSGDMARVDEDGYFYIVDRKKDLIIRGGYNVYPREVEEVLYEHPEDPRSRGPRHPPRRVGRGDRRRGRPPRRRGAAARGGQRLRQGADRRLQVPAGRLVHRRPAQGPDRQDPQARDRGAGSARLSRPPRRARSPRAAARTRCIAGQSGEQPALGAGRLGVDLDVGLELLAALALDVEEPHALGQLSPRKRHPLSLLRGA